MYTHTYMDLSHITYVFTMEILTYILTVYTLFVNWFFHFKMVRYGAPSHPSSSTPKKRNSIRKKIGKVGKTIGKGLKAVGKTAWKHKGKIAAAAALAGLAAATGGSGGIAAGAKGLGTSIATSHALGTLTSSSGGGSTRPANTGGGGYHRPRPTRPINT